jgi:hypothetical protein
MALLVGHPTTLEALVPAAAWALLTHLGLATTLPVPGQLLVLGLPRGSTGLGLLDSASAVAFTATLFTATDRLLLATLLGSASRWAGQEKPLLVSQPGSLVLNGLSGRLALGDLATLQLFATIAFATADRLGLATLAGQQVRSFPTDLGTVQGLAGSRVGQTASAFLSLADLGLLVLTSGTVVFGRQDVLRAADQRSLTTLVGLADRTGVADLGALRVFVFVPTGFIPIATLKTAPEQAATSPVFLPLPVFPLPVARLKVVP